MTTHPAGPGAGRPRPRPRPTPGGLPAVTNFRQPDAPFVGRDKEIAELHELLSRHKTVLLHDPEDQQYGFGKSQLVVAYCQRYMMRYKVAWRFQCGSPALQGRDELMSMVHAQLIEIRRGVRAVFGAEAAERPPAEDWLLVFDGVADPDEIAAHFPEGEGHILVTSHQPGSAWQGGTLALGELSASDADELLRWQAQHLTQRERADIAEIVGGHPERLVTVADLLSNGEVEFSACVRLLTLFPRHGRTPAGTVAAAEPAVPAPRTAEHDRISAQDKRSLVTALAYSPVGQSADAFQQWTDAIKERAELGDSFGPFEGTRMMMRLYAVTNFALEQQRPDVLSAMADACEEQTKVATDNHVMAVRRIIDRAVIGWAVPSATRGRPGSAEPPYEFLFFTSYPSRSADIDLVRQFHTRLEEEMMIRLGRDKVHQGFLDRRDLGLGEHWRPELREALRTAPLMLALTCDDYFGSEECGREWAVMHERKRRAGRPDAPPPANIIPLNWAPMRDDRPEVLDELMYTSVTLGPAYQQGGYVVDMVRSTEGEVFRKFIIELTELMIARAQGAPGPLEFDQLEALQPAFGHPRPPGRQL